MLTKEKLFYVDPTEKHIGATLVYLGSRSEYYIMQCFSINYTTEYIYNSMSI
jgi:hypothetical protein